MIKKAFTGIDGSYRITLDRYGNIVDFESDRKIYVIPSDKLIYLRETSDIENPKDLKNYYQLMIEDKFGDVEFEIYKEGNVVEILIFRDFDKPKDYFALDGEIFSLERAYRYLFKEDGYIFDVDKDKITFVEIKDSNVKSYRVVKGDTFTFLTDFKLLVEQLPIIEYNSLFVLSGDFDKLSDIKEKLVQFFNPKDVVIPSVCSPELFSAYGAALKGVLNETKFSFKQNSLLPEDRYKVVKVFLLNLAVYILIYLLIDTVGQIKFKDLKSYQTNLFKSYFPDVPAVSPYSQVKSMAVTGSEFDLSKKLLNINLPKNAKIYKIEYINGVLTVKGESDEPPEVAKSIKKTPLGKFEFEVELK